jgi:alpha-galactosidase
LAGKLNPPHSAKTAVSPLSLFMKPNFLFPRSRSFLLFLVPFLAVSLARAQESTPAYWSFALTPPMGWNSYDAFGSSVTEDEVMANATYMKDHLLSHGWKYVVIDYRWYDGNTQKYSGNGNVPGAVLTMDNKGRLLPAPNRFPSASDGHGFKRLADKIHAMGLKFGIHVMRGIPRQAVQANTPIEGSSFHASDAANTQDTCGWCADMYGVKGETPAGQAYYDSLMHLYASWGVDFVKIDDLSSPYRVQEIEAIRKAIDKCGRHIVFSTSPGETPVEEANHISTHANMWRVSADFWDNWNSLNHAFDLAAAWHGVAGPGHWPDFDMIPLGKTGLRSVGSPRMTAFSHDEQITLMSLWCLGPSPLMLGMDLPENDDWTLSLLTNDEVLAIDQDPLGQPLKRVSQTNGAEIWIRDLKDGSKAVGLFNRSEADTTVTLKWNDAGLSGKLAARDLWQHKDLGDFENSISLPVPKHGAVLLRLTQK